MTYFLLDHAVGSIQAGPDQQDRLDELTDTIASDEFYIKTGDRVPSACIDGRNGSLRAVPNAAGGSESLLVADDLTYKTLDDGDDSSTAGEYATLLGVLAQKGLPFGGHTDDHAAGDASGCGANDRLDAIYAFIAAHGDVLRPLAEALGAPVSDEAHALITNNARARHDFSRGAELLARLREHGGAVDTLHGAHREVVAVMNKVDATTLDRSALESRFGADYEAFNVDVWSFADAADAIAGEGRDATTIAAAMAYYNLATAHVLCGPGMRVVVRTSA